MLATVVVKTMVVGTMADTREESTEATTLSHSEKSRSIEQKEEFVSGFYTQKQFDEYSKISEAIVEQMGSQSLPRVMGSKQKEEYLSLLNNCCAESDIIRSKNLTPKETRDAIADAYGKIIPRLNHLLASASHRERRD